MNMFKQLIFILTMSVTMCVSGCTSDQSLEDNTVLEEEMPIETKGPEQDKLPSETTIPDNNIAPTDESRVIENEVIAVTVGNKWTEIPAEVVTNSISLMRTESESINVLPIPIAPGMEGITVEEYKPIVEETLSLQPQLEISKIDIEDREIGKVIYYEGKIDLTVDEVMYLVNNGIYTQAMVDEYGGASLFAEAINMNQIAMYYINNGKCVAITGQATNGADISVTKTEMESMINTVVFK